MTNEQSQKADEFEDIMARYRAFQERRAELFVVNKAKMFETLARLGITSILVRFDGYGDSGQIEEIDAVMGEVPTELPDIGIEIMVTNHGADSAFAEVQPLRQALETLCYSLLTRIHDGWENNDGAYGEFVLTTATATIALDFNYRITETEHHDLSSEEGAVGHCYHHALSSVRKWGGEPDEFLPLHQWFDEPSKLVTADFRHRALRHHAEGIFMLERFFGPTLTLSSGRVVPVRIIGEQHVVEDLGFVPSFADWVRCIRPEPWMGRAQPIHRLVDPFAAPPAGTAAE